MKNETVRFGEWNCMVHVAKYANGNTALQLIDEDGPVATATVNLNKKLPKNQAYIKDYSENAGMLAALEKAGVVVRVLGLVQTGYAFAHLCELNLEKLGVK